MESTLHKVIEVPNAPEFRIVEHWDHHTKLEDLKGDTFKADANPDLPIELLEQQELQFESLVANAGVFGYVLERWDPSVGVGWKHVDSCFGFVGSYDAKTNEHYIIEEMNTLVNSLMNQESQWVKR